jgi:hypothetical protein
MTRIIGETRNIPINIAADLTDLLAKSLLKKDGGEFEFATGIGCARSS